MRLEIEKWGTRVSGFWGWMGKGRLKAGLEPVFRGEQSNVVRAGAFSEIQDLRDC